MIKKEIDFFSRIGEAMCACPRLNTGLSSPTQTAGAIGKAYDDFAHINMLAGIAVKKYLYFLSNKKYLKNTDGIDEDFIENIEYSLAEAYEKLHELEEYITDRKTQNWG